MKGNCSIQSGVGIGTFPLWDGAFIATLGSGPVCGAGANPGSLAALGQGLVAFIPSGRSINPISKTNWEHVGVKPDVAVPAAEALKVAQVAVREKLVAEEQDPEERKALEEVLGKVRKGGRA